MIELNLLPEDYKEKPPKKSAIPIELLAKIPFLSKSTPKTLVIASGGTLAGIVILGLLFLLFLPTASIQSKLNAIQQQRKQIEKEVELATRLENEEEETSKVVTSLQKLEKERVLWSKILNEISDATPEQIQLTNLYIKSEEEKVAPKPAAAKKETIKGKEVKKTEGAEDKEPANTQKEASKGKKTVKKEKQIKKIRRVLMLEGLLSSGKDEALVNGFIENLKQTSFLSTLVSEIGLESVIVDDNGGKEFTVRCLYKEKTP